MLFYTYHLLLLFLPLASAASVQPSNDTLPVQASLLQLTYTSTGGMTVAAIVAPLTSEIGLAQSLTTLNTINIQGTLKSADAHSQDSITSANIAYISCDPNTNSSNISPTDIVNQLITVIPNVRAILLYSFTASHCSITGAFTYTSILSMTSIEDSHTLKSIIDMSITQPSATIMDQVSATTTSSASATSSTNGGSPASTSSTPAPTTAVAMSILYSITGIITLLFLIIIATGAIRAHRHPERYGPRGGLPGRPRQSRAKGLARAMLETLPIIKFGDGEVKPENRETELEEGGGEHQRDAAATPVQDVEGEAQPETNEDTAQETGIGPDEHAHTHAQGSHTEHPEVSEHLGCSICTEDFEKGEDVRVLPCNHKFHPACIDPWLLNVSGTCPLCRIDLRPAETNTAESEQAVNEDAALPPPLAETEDADAQVHPPRGRLSRRLDAALMRNASSHERIAALRQLRQQQIESGAAAAGPDAEGEEQSRRARLTGRLRDAFRIRTRPMPEPATADASEPATEPSTEPARTQGIEETL